MRTTTPKKKGKKKENHTIAKHEQLLPLAGSDFAQKGQQVVRDALGILAHQTRGVGAARVEVAQQGAVEVVEGLAGLLQLVPLGLDVVGDDLFHHGLGVAVRVGRADGAAFGDGDHVGEAGGVAVDGGGGREDDVGHVVLGHGAEEGDSAADVDAVVFEGDFARFTDCLRDEQRHVSRSGLKRTTKGRRGEKRTLRAAKWMTLSMAGCFLKTWSSASSSVTSSS